MNGLSIVLGETRATKVESAVDNLHVSVVQGVLDNFLVFFNLHQSNSSVQMGNVRTDRAGLYINAMTDGRPIKT
jgi:hypothetical protein